MYRVLALLPLLPAMLRPFLLLLPLPGVTSRDSSSSGSSSSQKAGKQINVMSRLSKQTD